MITTTVKTLHVLLNNFTEFTGNSVRHGNDEVHLRLFLPSSAFHLLTDDMEKSVLIAEDNKPTWHLNEDSNFECQYRYVNVLVDIEEGKTFKLELIQSNQDVEKEMSIPGDILPGRSPHVDHKKPVLA